MANISPITIKDNSKLSINKVSVKPNLVKVDSLKDYNAYNSKIIDYNQQISDLSKDNNIGFIGDINLDGKVNAYDEKILQEYLNLDRADKLAYATEHSHMFKTARLLKKYKDNPNLNEIINMAYNGDTYSKIEQTADETYGDTALAIAQKQANEEIIKEFKEAFTQDELTVGESGIDNFMSIVNGNNTYYDINGDGKTNLKDLTILQKYNQIVNNFKNDKNATSDLKINKSGNFSNLTDYQNVMLSAIDFIQYLAINGFDVSLLSGKKISECIGAFKVGNDDYQLQIFKTLVDNGFGDYKIVEVVQDRSFDAVVLQDPHENYRIFYNSTKAYGEYTSDFGDYLYDARNVIEEQFVNGWTDSLLEDTLEKTGTIAGGSVGSILGGLIGFFGSFSGIIVGGTIGAKIGKNLGLALYQKAIDAIRNGLDSDSLTDSAIISLIDGKLNDLGLDKSMKNQIIDAIKNGGLNGQYQYQQNKAKALAEKYYNKALSQNKKLSFQGFSLGGGLAEASYLSLCDIDGANKVLDGIVMYNPYHNNLTKEEAEKIKNAKGFELYCAEGDMVSTVFNYDDFKNDAKYLYMDYKSLFDAQVEDSETTGFKLDQLSNFGAIFGYTHINEPYLLSKFKGTQNQVAFAEDGSVRKNVNGYDVHGHNFEELSKYLFGGEEIENVDGLGKTLISELASSNLGVILSDEDLKNPSKVLENTGSKWLKQKIISLIVSYFASNMSK